MKRKRLLIGVSAIAIATGGGTLLLETKDRFVGPGGQTVALDDGVYRMVNHYYDRSDRGIPKLQIHDLGWTSDGWAQVASP